MALEIKTLAQREAERVAAGIRADRRLYLTADELRVVEEGDPEAAFLFAGVGTELLPGTMNQYGLSYENGKVMLKAQTQTEDKAAPAPEDKSAGPKGKKK